MGPLRVRSPQRFFAGLVLIGICLFVLWAVADLSLGTVSAMGPAMFPRSLAMLLGISGGVQVVLSFLLDGEPLQRWAIRGPVLVTVGILLFALTLRPFGLVVAGMLALVVSGFGIQGARPREVIAFSALVTVVCAVLFRYILEVSIPVLIIPGTGINF